jgi:hypothetical protein
LTVVLEEEFDVLVVVAAAAPFLALRCFLVCFLVVVVVVVESVAELLFGALSAWAPKERAAARAVPNIRVVNRFMGVIS